MKKLCFCLFSTLIIIGCRKDPVEVDYQSSQFGFDKKLATYVGYYSGQINGYYQPEYEPGHHYSKMVGGQVWIDVYHYAVDTVKFQPGNYFADCDDGTAGNVFNLDSLKLGVHTSCWPIYSAHQNYYVQLKGELNDTLLILDSSFYSYSTESKIDTEKHEIQYLLKKVE